MGVAEEGNNGETIKYSISENRGKSWSAPQLIEKDTTRSSSYALPYLTPNNRLYVFYNFNGDNVLKLKGKNIRNDMLGWFCFRYSDDEGKTWSMRYRIPLRKTKIDLENDWNGVVQMFWGIGKPIHTSTGMYFGFSKIGKHVIDKTEGWIMHSPNIDSEKDASKLEWQMLPDGEEGIKNPSLGLWQEEHDLVELSNGNLYCVYRTQEGFPAYSISADRGKTWKLPEAITYKDSGKKVRHPRACTRIWKCANGKFLLWIHNNSDGIRNPVWIAGGVEQNGTIEWSQPELLLYSLDTKQQLTYPDLIQVGENYWITTTKKTTAQIFRIDNTILNAVWSTPTGERIVGENLIWEHKGPSSSTTSIPVEAWDVRFPNLSTGSFTMELRLRFEKFEYGQLIFDNRRKTENNQMVGIAVSVGKEQNLVFQLNTGTQTYYLLSDPHSLKNDGKAYNIAFIVDGAANLIYSTVNGRLCDSGYNRFMGWIRIASLIGDVNGNPSPTISQDFSGKIESIRVYNRPLLISELMTNYLKGN